MVGTIGLLREHFSREYEIKIADYYFPWGRKRFKREIVYLVSQKKKYFKKKKRNDKCIISLPKLSDFHRSLDSSTIFKPKNY